MKPVQLSILLPLLLAGAALAPASEAPAGPGPAWPPCLRPDGAAAAAGGVLDERLAAIRAADEGTDWPPVLPGHRPPAPGEHPRLAFRPADLPELRRRATETAEGRAILARVLGLLEKETGPTDVFDTWSAAGYGFAYCVTGDAAQAERARESLRKTLFDNPAGRRGRGVLQDLHHGPRLLGLALALDFCWDAWPDPFRLRCVDEVQRRTWELSRGEFEGQPLPGHNPNPWSHHTAVRASCAGLGALAVLGETNSLGRAMEEAGAVAELCAREMRAHVRSAMGGGAYYLEGGYYKAMALERGLAYFPRACRNVLGRPLDADLPDGFSVVGYALESRPGTLIPDAPPVAWSAGMGTAAPDLLPGVKWLFDRAVGLEGNRSFGIERAPQAAYVLAAYPRAVEARHPAACFPWMQPDPRKGHWVFRPTLRDGDDILLTLNMKSENLKDSWASARSGRQCDFSLWGFGRRWLGGTYLLQAPQGYGGNRHLGGVPTSWRAGPGRTCVMNWNMERAYYESVPVNASDDAQRYARVREAKLASVPGWHDMVDYGVRGSRSMAVDCSGASGAPLLVALVDRIALPEPEEADGDGAAGSGLQAALRDLFTRETGIEIKTRPGTGGSGLRSAPSRQVRWALPLPQDQVPPMVRVAGNRFMLGYRTGASLTGVLVGPNRLAGNAVVSTGGRDYFCVFTLQPEGFPEIGVAGKGMDAVVTVGERTVRYGEKGLVLE